MKIDLWIWLLTGSILLQSEARAIANPNQYLCVVEQAIGLTYDKQAKHWKPQTFLAPKYILRRLKDEDYARWSTFLKKESVNWAFFPFEGQDALPVASCSDDADFFACRFHLKDAEFERTSLRFQMFARGGYVIQGLYQELRRKDPEGYKSIHSSEKEKPADSPDDVVIEIGSCSPF